MRNHVPHNSTLAGDDRASAIARSGARALCLLALLLPSLAPAGHIRATVEGFASTAAGDLSSCLLAGGAIGAPDTVRYDSTGADAVSISNPCSPLAGAVESRASASLGDHTLHVFAVAPRGANDTFPPDRPPYLSAAGGIAHFADDLHIFLGGEQVGAFPDGLAGELHMTVVGSKSPGARATAGMYLLGPADSGAGIVSNDLQASQTLVLPFHGSFEFSATLSVDVSDGEFADFGNSATMAIRLPAGYSFVTGSGGFLAVVPEPSAYALLLAGVVMLVLLPGRRRFAQASCQGTLPCRLP